MKTPLAMILVGLSVTAAAALPPPEVANVVWCPSGKDCLSWSGISGAQYRIYRGTGTTLPALLNSSVDSCRVRTVSDATTGPGALTETPGAGGVLWYLATARNCDGEGTVGSATSGSRVLDVSGDCTPATCSDGLQNGTEAAIDCGGSCPACAPGVACCTGTACASGSCVSGVCTTKSIGAPCLSGAECSSTFCVDGYCCTTMCTPNCQACNIVPGNCQPVPVGEPPSHGSCANCGLCNGSGMCCSVNQCTPPNGQCVQ
jgi:hypothetical protein